MPHSHLMTLYRIFYNNLKIETESKTILACLVHDPKMSFQKLGYNLKEWVALNISYIQKHVWYNIKLQQFYFWVFNWKRYETFVALLPNSGFQDYIWKTHFWGQPNQTPVFGILCIPCFKNNKSYPDWIPNATFITPLMMYPDPSLTMWLWSLKHGE